MKLPDAHELLGVLGVVGAIASAVGDVCGHDTKVAAGVSALLVLLPKLERAIRAWEATASDDATPGRGHG